MKMSVNGLKKKEFEHPQLGARHIPPSYGTSSQAQRLMSANPVQALSYSSSAEIPEAGDQISSSNAPNHSIFSKSKNASSFKWKQNVGVPRKKLSGSFLGKSKIAGKFLLAAVLAGSLFTTYKLHVLCRPFTRLYESHTTQPDRTMRTSVGAVNQRSSCSTSNSQSLSGNIGRRITMAIARSLIPFTQQNQNHTEQNAWPVNDLSLLIGKSGNNAFSRTQMKFREAESLVRRWQSIKAEALGPNHEIHRLSEILAEPMLSQWQALAESAKSSSCFWRFVLLHSSIVHAEISSDDIGWEIAEVEAVLEEAAELVDESQLKNPNYYSTYHIRYVLKRGSDRRWKFCGAGIQSPI